ncbi:MAG TPA: hypothetical protein VFN96_02525, partial [Gemmatimonadales bacterium]|nr:hypothetical protein [Gemmatimonadales bacterium]
MSVPPSWPSGSPSSGVFFDLEAKRARLTQLEVEQTDPAFWSNQERARDAVREIKSLKTWVTPAESLAGRLGDAQGMVELLDAEPDASL